MNNVQELDNLMQQYNMRDDKSIISISEKMHPLYKLLTNEERKNLYSLIKNRNLNWKHALIDLMQPHRDEDATRDEYNDVITACFDIIDSCYKQLGAISYSEKEFVISRCMYYLTQFHKKRLTKEEIEKLKELVFYIKNFYQNRVNSLENLEKLLNN